jgi:hypothetical protein
MIWLAVFPTLTVLNLVLGDWLKPTSPVLRTFVLATVAVPSVKPGCRAAARPLTPGPEARCDRRVAPKHSVRVSWRLGTR